MDINRADVLAELTEVFQRYEKALVDGDNETLVGYFWPGPSLVRFGLVDEQRGIDELRSWRLAQPPAPPGRRLFDTVITAFGTGFAVITTSFDYPDEQPPGRQSQTWLRTPAGWQIVSAHVSRPS
jgi:hypothetical protein